MEVRTKRIKRQEPRVKNQDSIKKHNDAKPGPSNGGKNQKIGIEKEILEVKKG
jgi:hypothetical protein